MEQLSQPTSSDIVIIINQINNTDEAMTSPINSTEV